MSMGENLLVEIDRYRYGRGYGYRYSAGILDFMDLLVLSLHCIRSIPFSFSCSAGPQKLGGSRDPLETGIRLGDMRMPGVRLGNKSKREAECISSPSLSRWHLWH